MLRWAAVTGGVVSLLAAFAVSGDAARAGGKARTHVMSPWGGGAYLGVALEDVRAEDVATLKLAEERGALIKEVKAETPAAKSGLKEGDVVLTYQGERVQSAMHLARLVRETPVGRQVSMDVSRQGSAQRVVATLGEDSERHAVLKKALRMLPEEDFDFVPEPPDPPLSHEDMDQLLKETDRAREEAGRVREEADRAREEADRVREEMHRFRLEFDRGPLKLGIRYQELRGQLAGYFKVEKGLLVTDVEQGGPAEKAGTQAGDVILKINGEAVASSRELRTAVGKLEAGSEATLTVQRQGAPLDLKVTVGGRARERTSRRGA